MKNKWWLNQLGLRFCIAYTILTLLCLSLAYGVNNENNFIFIQLPIVLQIALINVLGLSSLLLNRSWVLVYALIIPPTLAVLMVIGGLLQHSDKR